MNRASHDGGQPMRAAGAIGALLRLREWRVDQSRLELQRRRGEVEAAQSAVQAAGRALSEALAWSAKTGGLTPALHAQTLRHLAGLAADAERAAAELNERKAVANESRQALELHGRELDVLRRACDNAEAARRAITSRANWNETDDTWLAARRTAVDA
ncbi:MAG: hypothetical protein JWP57_4711 [Spirosoma sp.]|nr:hypothetical protein [Spirosoma sp.]